MCSFVYRIIIFLKHKFNKCILFSLMNHRFQDICQTFKAYIINILQAVNWMTYKQYHKTVCLNVENCTLNINSVFKIVLKRRKIKLKCYISKKKNCLYFIIVLCKCMVKSKNSFFRNCSAKTQKK